MADRVDPLAVGQDDELNQQAALEDATGGTGGPGLVQSLKEAAAGAKEAGQDASERAAGAADAAKEKASETAEAVKQHVS